MSAVATAIIAERPAEDGKPSITYRYAGDRAVQVEYGEMVFDLTLNFFVLAVNDALRHDRPDGLVETAPGFRSILVTYDPLELSTGDLVDHLHAVHDGLRTEQGIEIPSRLVRLPLAFNDSQTRQAVQRYIHSIRKDAPNAETGSNVDYIVRYNGLEGEEEFYETVLATEQWTAFIGFFPGLPFMFPLDPRDACFVPKYNPTRTWTPEGALGIGGPCYAIYPVESAGGYQLLGRTVPIYDLQARNAVFRENPLLLRAGDRVKFHRVDGGGAARALRGRSRRPLPLRDRRWLLRRRRLSRVAADDRRRGRRAASPPRRGRGRDAGAMSVAEVLEGGIQTTVQDYPGRPGMLAQGFFPAGPMDHFAFRAANLLVGNPESAAGLEVTLGNFALRFDADATVAVCGAGAPVTVDGEEIPAWESRRSACGV